MKNHVSIRTIACRENVAYLRSCVGAFCVSLEPTLEEIGDVKTAVSEAVTNACIHAYKGHTTGEILLSVAAENGTVYIDITDFGCGIEDIPAARRAFFTTAEKDERSGLGFTVMETFMDSLSVSNNPDGGITVSMSKKFQDNAVPLVPAKGAMSVRAQ